MIQRLRAVGVAVALLALMAGARSGVSAQQGDCIPLGTGTATVVGSVTTVRPADAVCGAAAARITAAKNEFEAFQVVVRGSNGSIAGVNVTAGALTGPGGATIAATNVTVYREGNYVVQVPSDSEGGTGAWPDALIPAVDNFYGERRNAFPVTVPSGESRVAWVDVFVPQGTPAGEYTGFVTVSGAGAAITIPVYLTVLNVTLPSTSSLASAFATHYGRVCDAHTGHFACDWDEDRRWSLHGLYAQAALDNRVTIANPVPMGINEGPSADQAAHFRKYILPMLRPDAVSFHNEWRPARLRDAQLTSVGLYNACDAGCLAAWRALATAAPRFDERMYIECIDEPSSAAHWNTCLNTVQTAAAVWPGLSTLVTSTIQQTKAAGADGSISILTPIVNRMHDKPGANSCCNGDQRSKYDSFLARAGTKLWMYTSDLSYSSDETVDPYWDGWAGYAIDQPASQSRAMGWLSFTYDVSGELYYATTERLPHAWTPGGLYEQGGNGDGTLFYPGTPAAIGGTRDIPLESIRLKRIRDGREDYEYLRILSDRGQRAFAQSIARSLFPTPYQTTVTQEAFDAARRSLIGKIAELTQPSTPPPSGPAPAVLSLSPGSVNLSLTAIAGGSVATSTSRTLRLTQTGGTASAWTASASSPYISISPASGSGPATLTVSVTPAASTMPWGPLSVTLTVSSASSTATSAVLLTRLPDGSSSAPFGLIDTPVDGATGVAGSLAVTGWALDDVGVRQVRILRDPVAGEGAAPVFIGTAVFVEGSRPDVAAAYEVPQNVRAGWGLMVLTNFLPNQGNGTFRLIAVADDIEGNSIVLGSRVITCSNSTATHPFGAIDTPRQGETISGNNYGVYGWVLSRGPALAYPPYGTVSLVIDGVIQGSPQGWGSRSDLTSYFPAATYPGVAHALGIAGLDTTALSDGLHTIAWLVTASDGKAEGIGSRYFRVDNSGAAALRTSASRQASATVAAAARSHLAETLGIDEVNAAPLDRSPMTGRRGYDANDSFQVLPFDGAGPSTMRGEEMDRFEVRVGDPAGAQYIGYLRTGDGLMPLPAGSHLDVSTGTFTWQPSVGFIHGYDLVFVRATGGRAISRQELRIVIGPKVTNRTGLQVVIDSPSPGAAASEPLVLAGWAVDLDSRLGTGVDMIHVWAYPLDGGAPLFVGVAAYGGKRPDVAGLFGDRFENAGYGLTVSGLPAGDYDLAAFAWSSVRRNFGPAQLVRVRVR